VNDCYVGIVGKAGSSVNDLFVGIVYVRLNRELTTCMSVSYM